MDFKVILQPLAFLCHSERQSRNFLPSSIRASFEKRKR